MWGGEKRGSGGRGEERRVVGKGGVVVRGEENGKGKGV